jgi:prepilin-type N-terminal cleavage/methylation domain-containing protein
VISAWKLRRVGMFIFISKKGGRLMNHEMRAPKMARRKRAGFGLLELIIALGILSVGLSALFGLYVTILKTNTHSHLNTVALQLAQEKLETIRLASYATLEGERETGLRVGGLEIEFLRETTIVKRTAPPLAEVTVKVTWPSPFDSRRTQSTELATQLAG